MLAYRILCDNIDHDGNHQPQHQHSTLNKLLEYIITEAGEGVVLRRHASLYQHGRSSDLLKLKVSSNVVYNSIEALVTLQGIARR